MPLFRLTDIYQMSTTPAPSAPAIVHTAGWTESIWTDQTLEAVDDAWSTLTRARVALLPTSAAAVAYRTQAYTLSTNKLLPGGSGSGSQFFRSARGLVTDLPQAALELKVTNTANASGTRMVLRCMPDEFIVGGEYAPDATFTRILNIFIRTLTSGKFGWVGRDLLQPSVRVISLLNGVLTVDQVPPGMVADAWIRLHRVYDNNDNPVKGTYQIASILGKAITLKDPPAQTVNKASGLVRVDALKYIPYTGALPSRATVRKVGRPSQGYRGRRSKSRV